NESLSPDLPKVQRIERLELRRAIRIRQHEPMILYPKQDRCREHERERLHGAMCVPSDLIRARDGTEVLVAERNASYRSHGSCRQERCEQRVAKRRPERRSATIRDQEDSEPLVRDEQQKAADAGNAAAVRQHAVAMSALVEEGVGDSRYRGVAKI